MKEKNELVIQFRSDGKIVVYPPGEDLSVLEIDNMDIAGDDANKTICSNCKYYGYYCGSGAHYCHKKKDNEVDQNAGMVPDQQPDHRNRALPTGRS